uniref:DUF4806 domain-containing protein n=1 Tax=Elaeophora elaphi TaxID=1147741 RepID=A0A0R3RU61_9BILA
MGRSIQTAKIGRKGFNGRKALADMVTEFLEITSHTVLFHYSGYSAEMFDMASYGDILIHKCRVKEVIDYVKSALQTIHRWIRFDELSHFAACILDKDNKVMMEVVIIIMGVQYSHLRSRITSLLHSFRNMKICDLFFELRIYFSLLLKWAVINDHSATFVLTGDYFRDILTSEAVDMKRQFQQTIFTLQRGSYIENMKNVFQHEKVRFEIRTKLRGNCVVKLKKRAEDCKWEKCNQCAPENLRPCGRRIDSKLIEIVAMVRQLDKM